MMIVEPYLSKMLRARARALARARPRDFVESPSLG